jgi:hypothetical protein
MRIAVLLAALVLTPLAAACGHEDACGGHSHDPACLVCDGSENPLTPGSMLTASSGFTVELVTVTPTPMTNGNNVMTVKVRQDGNLVDGVAFYESETFKTETWYPAGGHGSPLLPTVTATGNPGEYTLTAVNFLHAGHWEMRFRMSLGGVMSELFVPLCIEEAAGA